MTLTKLINLHPPFSVPQGLPGPWHVFAQTIYVPGDSRRTCCVPGDKQATIYIPGDSKSTVICG